MNRLPSANAPASTGPGACSLAMSGSSSTASAASTTPAAKCWIRLRVSWLGFQTVASNPPPRATTAGIPMIKAACAFIVMWLETKVQL